MESAGTSADRDGGDTVAIEHHKGPGPTPALTAAGPVWYPAYATGLESLARRRLQRNAIMADIFQEVEEDLRRDRYERLARKYGGHVIAAVLLIVAGTAGYVLWKNWHQARLQADTLQLAEAVDAAGPGAANPAAATALDKVATSAASGPGRLARFYEAGLKARAGDGAGAVAIYDAIAAEGATAPLYRDLASLLAVQLQVNAGDPKALADRLAPLTVDSNPWRYSARELTALLAARTGDKARAKTLFQQLADDNGAPAGLRTRASELAAFFGRTP